ncbi:MAG: hypothetical protein KIT73_00765, partial [Burkholderiales bacterium]|nr:hypothetical protein [Burkholderiales bacterium]
AAPLLISSFSSGSSNTTISFGGASSTVAAGQFLGQFDAASNGYADDPVLRLFCVDIAQHVAFGQNYTNFTASEFSDLDPRASLLGRLYGEYYDGINSPIASAAFQIAVWEIWNDGVSGLDLATGTFRALSGDAIATASGMLSSLASLNDNSNWVFTVFASPTQQDQLTGYRVPEPNSLALAALTLVVGLSVVRQQRNQQTRRLG